MSSAVVFVLVCCVNAKKTLHKARLTALHAICLQISLQSLFRIFRFLFHLTKNLTTHLSHNLRAVLP